MIARALIALTVACTASSGAWSLPVIESGPPATLADPALLPAASSEHASSDSLPQVGEGSGPHPEDAPQDLASEGALAEIAAREQGQDLLRLIVNAKRGEPHEKARRPAGAPAAAEPEGDDVLDAELEARLDWLRRAGGEALRWALNPAATEDGLIAFSLPGIDGFTLVREGGSMTFGFHDTALLTWSEQPDDGRPPAWERPAGADAGDAAARNAILRGLLVVWNVLTHPFTLAAAGLVVVLRLLAALIARTESRRARPTATRKSRRRARPPSARPGHGRLHRTAGHG